MCVTDLRVIGGGPGHGAGAEKEKTVKREEQGSRRAAAPKLEYYASHPK
jgi:hypothetical protein